jgi:hypothetical protein
MGEGREERALRAKPEHAAVTILSVPKLFLKKAAALLTVAVLLSLYAFCLPRPLFNEPYSYVLLARDGSLLSARAATDGHWRFPARGQVPHKFEEALLASRTNVSIRIRAWIRSRCLVRSISTPLTAAW